MDSPPAPVNTQFHCAVCDTTVGGTVNWQAHLQSKNHEKHVKTTDEFKIADEDLYADEDMPVAKFIRQHRVTFLGSESIITEKISEQLKCVVCRVLLKDFDNVTAHLKGSKHQSTYMEKHFPNVVKAINQKANRRGERDSLFQKAVDEVIKSHGKKTPLVHDPGYAQRIKDLERTNAFTGSETEFKYLQKKVDKSEDDESKGIDIDDLESMPTTFAVLKTLLTADMTNFEEGEQCYVHEELARIEQPVVGLEYVAEYCDPQTIFEPGYLCTLCELRLNPRQVVVHVVDNKHRLNFMAAHHKTHYTACSFRALSESRKAELTEKYAKEIEEKDGRGTLSLRINLNPAHRLHVFALHKPYKPKVKPAVETETSSQDVEDDNRSGSPISRKSRDNSEPLRRPVSSHRDRDDRFSRSRHSRSSRSRSRSRSRDRRFNENRSNRDRLNSNRNYRNQSARSRDLGRNDDFDGRNSSMADYDQKRDIDFRESVRSSTDRDLRVEISEPMSRDIDFREKLRKQIDMTGLTKDVDLRNTENAVLEQMRREREYLELYHQDIFKDKRSYSGRDRFDVDHDRSDIPVSRDHLNTLTSRVGMDPHGLVGNAQRGRSPPRMLAPTSNRNFPAIRPNFAYSERAEKAKQRAQLERLFPSYVQKNLDCGYYSYRDRCIDSIVSSQPPYTEVVSLRTPPETLRVSFYEDWSPLLMRRVQDKFNFKMEHIKWLKKLLIEANVPLGRPVTMNNLRPLEVEIETAVLVELVDEVLMPNITLSRPQFMIADHNQLSSEMMSRPNAAKYVRKRDFERLQYMADDEDADSGAGHIRKRSLSPESRGYDDEEHRASSIERLIMEVQEAKKMHSTGVESVGLALSRAKDQAQQEMLRKLAKEAILRELSATTSPTLGGAHGALQGGAWVEHLETSKHLPSISSVLDSTIPSSTNLSESASKDLLPPRSISSQSKCVDESKASPAPPAVSSASVNPNKMSSPRSSGSTNQIAVTEAGSSDSTDLDALKQIQLTALIDQILDKAAKTENQNPVLKLLLGFKNFKKLLQQLASKQPATLKLLGNVIKNASLNVPEEVLNQLGDKLRFFAQSNMIESQEEHKDSLPMNMSESPSAAAPSGSIGLLKPLVSYDDDEEGQSGDGDDGKARHRQDPSGGDYKRALKSTSSSGASKSEASSKRPRSRSPESASKSARTHSREDDGSSKRSRRHSRSPSPRNSRGEVISSHSRDRGGGSSTSDRYRMSDRERDREQRYRDKDRYSSSSGRGGEYDHKDRGRDREREREREKNREREKDRGGRDRRSSRSRSRDRSQRNASSEKHPLKTKTSGDGDSRSTNATTSSSNKMGVSSESRSSDKNTNPNGDSKLPEESVKKLKQDSPVEKVKGVTKSGDLSSMTTPILITKIKQEKIDDLLESKANGKKLVSAQPEPDLEPDKLSEMAEESAAKKDVKDPELERKKKKMAEILARVEMSRLHALKQKTVEKLQSEESASSVPSNIPSTSTVMSGVSTMLPPGFMPPPQPPFMMPFPPIFPGMGMPGPMGGPMMPPAMSISMPPYPGQMGGGNDGQPGIGTGLGNDSSMGPPAQLPQQQFSDDSMMDRGFGGSRDPRFSSNARPDTMESGHASMGNQQWNDPRFPSTPVSSNFPSGGGVLQDFSGVPPRTGPGPSFNERIGSGPGYVDGSYSMGGIGGGLGGPMNRGGSNPFNPNGPNMGYGQGPMHGSRFHDEFMGDGPRFGGPMMGHGHNNGPMGRGGPNGGTRSSFDDEPMDSGGGNFQRQMMSGPMVNQGPTFWN